MNIGDNELGINVFINELEDNANQFQSFKNRPSYDQQIWWDTFSIGVPLVDDKGSEVSEKRWVAKYPENKSVLEMWF
ncbi:MAG: hypothetical protein WCP85_18545 [Mariniphaga sp.]